MLAVQTAFFDPRGVFGFIANFAASFALAAYVVANILLVRRVAVPRS
jgi:hypothetical protein